MTKIIDRTEPDPTLKTMPPGIPYIIGNELAERFSFYGMKGILVVFMTKYLLDKSGNNVSYDPHKAEAIYHLFTAGAYFFPLIGAMIADIFWGKYKSILIISLMYCLGHGFLALMDAGPATGLWDMKPFLFAGLICIAIGAGGIKPCVSAHVGDQFGKGNKHLLTQVFNWFYFSINLGAAASTLLTPLLLKEVGPWAAFGLPGVLMALATFMFWLGRHTFVHVPPSGWAKFKRETFSPEGMRALRCLIPLFLLFVPVFWAIFDQSGSAWIIQADSMDRRFLGVNWLQSQIQAVNPLFILTLIPFFTYVVYPVMGKFFEPTPLRKIGIGFFFTALAFGISGLIEARISGGHVNTATHSATLKNWNKSKLIDGPADGFGWASTTIDWNDPEHDNPEIHLRLRERKPWTINAVQINPYAVMDEPIPVPEAREGQSGYEAYQAYLQELKAYKALSKEEREALHQQPDTQGMAKSVDVYIHHPGELETVSTTDTAGNTTTTQELAWVKVGSLNLTPEDKLQTLTFDPQLASMVKVVVTGSNGARYAKLGQISVLADTTVAQASDKAQQDHVWPDVAAIGFMPNIGWQFLAYLVLTSAEILVSIVCLEFAYTQSPPRMKSFIMGIFFLGVSFGNFVVAGVNIVLDQLTDAEGNTPLDGPNYYYAFAGLMLLTLFVYVFFAKFYYKGQTYIQGEVPEDIEAEVETEAIGDV